MKWKVELRGHTVTVEIDQASEREFSGRITSTEHGPETLYDCEIRDGVYYATVDVDGLEAKLSAAIQPDGSLSGNIRIGWFFNAHFIGTKVE